MSSKHKLLTPDEQEYAAELGEIIQFHRKETNLSLEVLAAKINITPDALNSIEQGYAIANIYQIQIICQVCGIEFEELIAGLTVTPAELGERTPRDYARRQW